MSRDHRRIQLAPAYILHHRPYRDTSRILDVLTRDHGRLTLFARGVRGPKARLAAALQPFRLLLNDRRFHHVPMYIETPKGEVNGEDLDAINLRTLRRLIRR